MSFRHLGLVTKVTRTQDYVEIEADFADRPRTFCVRATEQKIGPYVVIYSVAGQVGPVQTGPRDGPYEQLSPPLSPGIQRKTMSGPARTRKIPGKAGAQRSQAPAAVRSSPVHQTFVRPGFPAFAGRAHPCTLQSMNQMTIPRAVQRVLDAAGVARRAQARYQELALHLWNALEPDAPEDVNDPAVQECLARTGCADLDLELVRRIAQVVTHYKRRSRSLLED